MRNEIKTERNETKRNEIKQNETKLIKTKRNEIFIKRNVTKKNEKFNMAWRLRGFIIYWLSKFRRLKGFQDLYYNDYPNLLYLSFFFLYEDWGIEDVRDLKIINRSKGVRNCTAARQLFQFHSSRKITAPDCFLSATIKIQRGNFKNLLNSLWGPA